MDKDISTTLGRLERYLFRVKRATREGDLVAALSDTAELAEIARRLWIKLADRIKISETAASKKEHPYEFIQK